MQSHAHNLCAYAVQALREGVMRWQARQLAMQQTLTSIQATLAAQQAEAEMRAAQAQGKHLLQISVVANRDSD